jgi:NADH-quinone oxidoreductase subunit F
MSKLPHLLIEGMIAGSYALGARTSYIYIRGELLYVLRILEKAIAEAYAAGFLGENIQGSGYSLDLHVHPGGGAYICGEETSRHFRRCRVFMPGPRWSTTWRALPPSYPF